MLSLDAFVESLIQEKDKLVQMGVIQKSKNQALLMTDSNNVQERGKHKWKETKNNDSKPRRIINLLMEPRVPRKRRNLRRVSVYTIQENFIQRASA